MMMFVIGLLSIAGFIFLSFVVFAISIYSLGNFIGMVCVVVALIAMWKWSGRIQKRKHAAYMQDLMRRYPPQKARRTSLDPFDGEDA